MLRQTPELTTTTAPALDPAQQAVSQVSAAVLVSLLLVVLVTCVLVLLALRRRSRAQSTRRDADLPADAWAESARRVDLEEHPDIPREPGTE